MTDAYLIHKIMFVLKTCPTAIPWVCLSQTVRDTISDLTLEKAPSNSIKESCLKIENGARLCTGDCQ